MSYESKSTLPKSVKLESLCEFVDLLNYKSSDAPSDQNGWLKSCFWFDDRRYKSSSGVELDIFEKNGRLEVYTRTPAGRSYWDLEHQNKTIRLMKSFFGGRFFTDEGFQKYFLIEESSPTALDYGFCSIYNSFFESIDKVESYLRARNLNPKVAWDYPFTGFYSPLDEMNPKLLSNNMLLVFIIAVWEDYFRSLFLLLLESPIDKSRLVKNINFGRKELSQVLLEGNSVERSIADSLAFQRPSVISENFKFLDQGISISSWLKEPPFGREGIALYDSIEQLVNDRNKFVHIGRMNTSFYDKNFGLILHDVVSAVERVHEKLWDYCQSLCSPQSSNQ